MSDLLLPVRAPDVHTTALAPNDVRLGVTDRLALRLGLWLLLRSENRLQHARDYTARTQDRRTLAARTARELAALRQLQLAPRV